MIGPFGVLGGALVVEHYLRRTGETGRGSGRYVVKACRKEAPVVLAAAERMMELNLATQARANSLLEALPEVWDALAPT